MFALFNNPALVTSWDGSWYCVYHGLPHKKHMFKLLATQSYPRPTVSSHHRAYQQIGQFKPRVNCCSGAGLDWSGAIPRTSIEIRNFDITKSQQKTVDSLAFNPNPQKNKTMGSIIVIAACRKMRHSRQVACDFAVRSQ